MAGSLQDQLLQAGLADTAKAKRLAKDKRKQANVARRGGHDPAEETREAARQALANKAERDRELNEARNAEASRKAINAQIRQLVESHKLPRGKGDVGFNFTDGTKVKKLYVTSMDQKQLAAGNIAIVKQGDQYEMLPRPIADKIAERDAARVIICSEAGATGLSSEEQDWYKDYEIPDDLMW
ncbi:MAG: nucleoprotein/polynucleotide-associated enzyme [Haliea sp.]|uniref:DUF2058 domain-containing protein n=1 Tax=Haliea sp. TaxID=1932666 RepID=UPI000C3E9412|nr:DUF2058 domain-containing protein [Haliea sp.]MBM69413.1 nucleoprotein/polynucleotide-associated enzyme [Haliea sp.]|tara:strand:+ start:15174 stop:15722 length:549 start_codon:yes stop_codon:yes gene_type:complete